MIPPDLPHEEKKRWRRAEIHQACMAASPYIPFAYVTIRISAMGAVTGGQLATAYIENLALTLVVNKLIDVIGTWAHR